MQYGPKIVTDSLVLALDAADANSYPGSGNTWYDLTSNNNDATINSATYNSNGYFDFNGTSNFMTIPYNASLDFRTTNFTIQTWFQPQKILCGLISMGDIDPSSNHVYSITYNTQYHLVAEMYLNDIIISTSSQLNLNTWANVAVTRNGNTVTIYTNGEILSAAAVYPNPATIGTISGGTPDLIIGKQFVGGSVNQNFFYDGLASNVLLYNRSLSANEVQQNYNATKSRFT